VFLREYEIGETLEEQIEKMVILTHLFSRDFQLFLDYGHSKDLKDHLWKGRFADDN